MSTLTTLSRGEFLKLSASAGAGLVLGFHLPGADGLLAADADGEFEPNVWLTVAPSGEVSITSHRCEMGQGVWTALPMIVAEELSTDWSRVRVRQGDLDPAYGPQTTGGSASVRTNWEKLRKAGAVARTMLVGAAAKEWGVDPGSCRAAGGVVSHPSSGRSLGYGALADAAARLDVPEEVALKDPADFTLVGTSTKRLSTPAKTDGTFAYGWDFERPGMLVACIARPRVFGGEPASFDAAAAREVPGVRDVFEVSAGVAVLAEHTHAALKGREALEVRWSEGPNAGLSSEGISARLEEACGSPGESLRDDGGAGAALDGAARTLEATYEFPYLDHAPMEPMNCSALIADGICRVWAPTQTPRPAQRTAAEASGLPEEKVEVDILFSGGGFGRRLRTDFVRDAVEVAKEVEGTPVKVFRTRDEDIAHGFYRPATHHVLRGGLDDGGRPVAWWHRLAGATGSSGLVTGGADEMAYGIPAVHVDYALVDVPVPTGAWRSVAHTHNAFVIETFIDELAVAAGEDPYRFRRRLLGEHPRHVGVLDLAAEEAGWGSPPAGRHQGIAVHHSFYSWAAMVAEISVADDGAVTVHRMTAAVDCGRVVNPDGVRMQVEGGIVLGLTAALKGAITVEDGGVAQSNFHDYPLLKLGEMPRVDVHIVDSTERPTGIGEPPVPPTPPAVANAIARATGRRIRRLPIRREDVMG